MPSIVGIGAAAYRGHSRSYASGPSHGSYGHGEQPNHFYPRSPEEQRREDAATAAAEKTFEEFTKTPVYKLILMCNKTNTEVLGEIKTFLDSLTPEERSDIINKDHVVPDWIDNGERFISYNKMKTFNFPTLISKITNIHGETPKICYDMIRILIDAGLNKEDIFVKNIPTSNYTILNFLLDNGLDVNTRRDGKTLLDSFMIRQEYYGDDIVVSDEIHMRWHSSIIKNFISKNAKITPEDFLFNLSQIQVSSREIDPVSLLWDKYFVPEMINQQRLPYMDTPLIHAARLGNFKTANLFITHGAKTAIKNNDGQTALHCIVIKSVGISDLIPKHLHSVYFNRDYNRYIDGSPGILGLIILLIKTNPILTKIKDNSGKTPVEYFPSGYNNIKQYKKTIISMTPWVSPKNTNLLLNARPTGTVAPATATCAPGDVGCFSFLGKGGKRSRRKIHKKKTRKVRRS